MGGVLGFSKLAEIFSRLFPLSHMEKKYHTMIKARYLGVIMALRINHNDCRILEALAEYRTLTPTQIKTFYQKSQQVVWRRLRALEKEGLIRTVRHELGRGRGRPEGLFGLNEQGVDILREKGLIGRDVPYERIIVDGPFCLDHQLLVNWFRIYLNQVERAVPRVSVKFLAHNSPFLPKTRNGGIFITDYSPVPDSGERGVRFTPDATFSISDSAANKTCLFFLEVDRGTETVASPKRDMGDIRQRIINYQWYQHKESYKRYDEVFNYNLFGFRLLFLTSTYSRLAALCKLTQEVRPSNFVWLTECSRLFHEGVAAKIWAEGGDLQGQQGSILGSLYYQAPLS